MAGVNFPMARLFPNAAIRNLVLAQVASQMGDQAFEVLLLWSVLEMTSSRSMVGAAAMVSYLPILLFGMAGGLAADRLPRRTILAASDLSRAGVAFSIPLFGLAGLLSPWLLAGTGFLLFTASAFFNPARDASVPSLVEPSGLVAANTAVQFSIPAGLLLGPSLCSALLLWFKPVDLFAVAGGLFLVSVSFLARLPKVPAAAKGGPPGASDVFSGLKAAWDDPRLRWLLAITAVDNLFIMGPAIVGTPLFVKEVLHAGDRTYALTQACYAVGMFLGLPVTAWLNRRFGQGKVLIAAIFLDGITYLPFLWLRTPWAMALTIVAHAVAIPMITVTRASLVQRIAPPASLGRIFALISITVIGLTAISSGLTGWAAERVPINVIYGLIAVAAALCAPAAWLSKQFREA